MSLDISPHLYFFGAVVKKEAVVNPSAARHRLTRAGSSLIRNGQPMAKYGFVSAHFVLVTDATSYTQCRFLVWSVTVANQSDGRLFQKCA
jgi:hypothetical protein